MSGAAPSIGWATPGEYRPRLRRRRTLGFCFACGCLAFWLLALGALFALLFQVFRHGWSRLSWRLVTHPPSTLFPDAAGFQSALLGTLWLVALTAIISITIGVGAAIYLEEFAPRSRWWHWIKLNISNLAGVPSIVYGILGMVAFVRWLRTGESILAGALTLSLLILPVIIIAAREAIAAVPDSLRHAALALGATRWQTVWHHVLPAASPGVLTGVILALSRAIGETAPLIMIGAVGYIAFVPGRFPLPPSIDSTLSWLHAVLFSRFTAMPIQIYDWTSNRPQEAFKELAAAGIILLLAVLLVLNGLAASIRAWRLRHRI